MFFLVPFTSIMLDRSVPTAVGMFVVGMYVVSNSHVALYRGRPLLFPCLSPGDRHLDGIQSLASTKSTMKNILIPVLSQPV